MANENNTSRITIAHFGYIEKGQISLELIPQDVIKTLSGPVPFMGLVYRLDELLGLYSHGPMKGSSKGIVERLAFEFPYETTADVFTSLDKKLRGYSQKNLPSGIVVVVNDVVDEYRGRIPVGYDFKIFE